MNLTQLGWKPSLQEYLISLGRGDWVAARVVMAGAGQCRVRTEQGERRALRGRQHTVVGDWVALEIDGHGGSVVRAVLPRESAVVRHAAGSRKAAGGDRSRDQVLAANVDLALVVTGLDRDFNPRRIERYVTLAYGCGVQPVVVLNKVDVCPDLPGTIALGEASAPGCRVVATSGVTALGVEALRGVVAPGITACLLGSSGAGKSTLLNCLLGAERQRTGATGGPAGKGRHTTTHRELFPVPGGGAVIDSPGLREIGLGAGGDGLQEAFPDLMQAAGACRYRDCRHQDEPGCAVRAAAEAGAMDPLRLASYHKLAREQEHRELVGERGAAAAERRKWKAVRKEVRRMYKA